MLILAGPAAKQRERRYSVPAKSWLRNRIDTRTGTRAALLSAFVLAALPSTTAQAHLQSYSFVWGSTPTSSSYEPLPSYAYNDAGGGGPIIRTGTGSYEVHFYGLENATEVLGNVQVSAYGSGTNDCQMSGWRGTLRV